MKKGLLFFGTFLMFGLTVSTSYGQNFTEKPKQIRLEMNPSTPEMIFQAPNLEQIQQEDAFNDALGMRYRIGVGIDTDITLENSGIWSTKPNGDRVWHLKINYPGAQALSFMFNKFILHGDAKISIFDLQGKELHKTYGSSDVLDHGQQNMSLCYSDQVVIQLVEPAGNTASTIEINQIFYGYRGTGNPNVPKDFGDSESCQVNVNCTPEGTNWQDEKRGVARILVVDGPDQGWCTGSMVNNLAANCKPYFLTALHCGVTSTTANFNQWRFYFKFEASACTDPGSQGSLANNFITGCIKLASSNDGGGDSGSDFLLVQMGSLANEATTITTLKSAAFNGYWNGWDANTSASPNGVSIHHPAGDIKKISTYNSSLVSNGWNGNGLQSHWRVVWSSTTNGFGVTEGGSSGSPIFTTNGGNSRIVGTLTGGGSFCNATNQPDYYGKMSYHWITNGTPANERLKTYLDPNNTGTLVMDGSADPCGTVNPGTYCGATSTTECSGTPNASEFISGVQLSTLLNFSNCSNYTDFTSMSVTLVKGQSYVLTIQPETVGGTPGQTYPDDEIASYIDFNDDGDFSDASEQVGYYLVGSAGSSAFTFTVPTTATVGTTRMRVRISYFPEDGSISPCGTTIWGETEDYTVNIANVGAGIEENEFLASVSIYPNPTNENLTIDLSSLPGETTLRLFDLSGKLIQTQNTKNGELVKWNIANLANGMYNLEISSELGQTMRKISKF